MTDRSCSKVSAHQYHLDLLRITAAFLVIVNHTNSQIFQSNAPSFTWFSSLTYFFVSKIAVPLFLLITGALLLGKQDSIQKTTSRLLRIALVGLAFSCLQFISRNYASLSISSIPQFFMHIWTGTITNSYWYLYLYMGVLLTLPLLQRMASAFSRQQIQYLLLLSLLLCGIYPLFPIFFKHTPNLYLTEPLFSPYIGLLFAGYYIEKYMTLSRRTFLCACAGFVFLIAFQVIATWFFYKTNPNNYLALDDRVFLPITGSAICFYIMAKYAFQSDRLPQKYLRCIRYAGSLTFCIYLLSDIAIRNTAAVYAQLSSHIHVLPAMLIWEILIFVICALAAAILKSIPGLSKWI